MTYVLSDIHGHRPRFDGILRQIGLQPEDTLYVLGDVVDRNPHGISILRQLMEMPNVRMILGNHEHMMLDALYLPHGPTERARRTDLWHRNGGDVTHKELERLSEGDRAGLFAYLKGLPLNETVTVHGRRYVLAHGAPAALFKTYEPFTDCRSAREFALWHRFTGREQNRGKATIIFGHTGTIHYQTGTPMRIWHGDGFIGIDCGAAYTGKWESLGRLACLRLDDMMEFYAP